MRKLEREQAQALLACLGVPRKTATVGIVSEDRATSLSIFRDQETVRVHLRHNSCDRNYCFGMLLQIDHSPSFRSSFIVPRPTSKQLWSYCQQSYPAWAVYVHANQYFGSSNHKERHNSSLRFLADHIRSHTHVHFTPTVHMYCWLYYDMYILRSEHIFSWLTKRSSCSSDAWCSHPQQNM